MGYCDRTIGIAIHCLPDDNTNTTIKDSIYFHFFELPSDLERIQKFLGEIKSMLKPKGEVFIVGPKFFYVSRPGI